MSVTIRQEPTTPGIANSNLVFMATSNQSTEPQFQFVVDIKDENDNLIQRIKQQPNPSEKGVFDIGNLVTPQLGPADRIWDISSVTANTNSGKDFRVLFGEEYGTSTSSSVTLYDGAGSSGDPAVTSSYYYFNLDGFLNESQAINFNWNSGSKYDEEHTSSGSAFTHQNGLTDFSATQSIRLEDYHTISFLNGNTVGVENSVVDSSSAQDVYAVIIRQYDSTDTEISESVIYNLAGPRSNQNDLWADVYTSQSQDTRLVHFPAGPENLEDAGFPISSSCTYYTLTFNAQSGEPGVAEDSIWGEYKFNITTANCGYSGVRFAWKNRYGVWDYYNFALAESTTSTIERKEYQQSFVDYSTTSNSVTYDRERRGRNNYYNKVTKNRTAQTDYLNQTDADNIREMFFSTDVYLQRPNGEWWPVVITDASITEKTNPRTQKLYRYSVNYTFANGQRDRE